MSRGVPLFGVEVFILFKFVVDGLGVVGSDAVAYDLLFVLGEVLLDLHQIGRLR